MHMSIYICHMSIQAPRQGVESNFRCWIAEWRLEWKTCLPAEKECAGGISLGHRESIPTEDVPEKIVGGKVCKRCCTLHRCLLSATNDCARIATSAAAAGRQSYTSEGVWRQGIGSSVRNSEFLCFNTCALSSHALAGALPRAEGGRGEVYMYTYVYICICV